VYPPLTTSNRLRLWIHPPAPRGRASDRDTPARFKATIDGIGEIALEQIRDTPVRSGEISTLSILVLAGFEVSERIDACRVVVILLDEPDLIPRQDVLTGLPTKQSCIMSSEDQLTVAGIGFRTPEHPDELCGQVRVKAAIDLVYN